MDNHSNTAWTEAKATELFICVETYSGHRLTTRDPHGPQHLLPPNVSDLNLGSAVLDSLMHSRFVDPDDQPDEDMALFDYDLLCKRYTDWTNNLMKIFNFATKEDLFKNMNNCLIERRDGIIKIRPTHHDTLEGWSGDEISEDSYVVIPAESPPATIGAALRLALSRCT